MQKFPMVVYHVALGNTVVNGETELQRHLKEGWSESPVKMSKANMIKAKIAHHESELARLREVLVDLEGSGEPEEPKKGKRK